MPATVCYGLTSVFGIISFCVQGKESDYTFGRIFCYSFILLVAFGVLSYELVLIRNYPEFGEVLCFEKDSCIEIYKSYAFTAWVASLFLKIYFSFILIKYKDIALYEEIDRIKFE